jgi:hypothetical protein
MFDDSAHPTSGGPYFWAAMLSTPEQAAVASWITGELDFLPQLGGFCGPVLSMMVSY